MQIQDIMDIAEWHPITTDCLQPETGNCLSHAVCDDSVALMPLLCSPMAAIRLVEVDTIGTMVGPQPDY